MATLDSKIPPGPLADKWSKHKTDIKLVNPANKRKYEVIVVGSGLAGASAAASLGELGYQVKCFCFQDSPRRAHSIADLHRLNPQAEILTSAADALAHRHLTGLGAWQIGGLPAQIRYAPPPRHDASACGDR